MIAVRFFTTAPSTFTDERSLEILFYETPNQSFGIVRLRLGAGNDRLARATDHGGRVWPRHQRHPGVAVHTGSRSHGRTSELVCAHLHAAVRRPPGGCAHS